MAWIAPVVGAAASLIGGAMNSSAQRAANRQNIGLNRETREWETTMSNTAVQRRAADIEAAGGNRALAFVNGEQASTPTITAPTVESTKRGDALSQAATGAIAAAAAKAQIANINAQTAVTQQTARQEKLKADALEKWGPSVNGATGSFELDYMSKAQNVALNAIDIQTKQIQANLSAAQLEQFNRTKHDLAQEIANQAKIGKLDAESLERLVNLTGLNPTAGRMLLDAAIQAFGILKRAR